MSGFFASVGKTQGFCSMDEYIRVDLCYWWSAVTQVQVVVNLQLPVQWRFKLTTTLKKVTDNLFKNIQIIAAFPWSQNQHLDTWQLA